MALISSLFPLLRMHCKDCPDPTMEDALLFAARDFCRKTRWLRETLSLDLVQNQNVYPLTPSDAATKVIAVKAVEQDGAPLEPATQEEVEDNTQGVYFFEPAGTLKLGFLPLEDIDSGLEVRVILQPADTAASLPDSLVNECDQAIAHGALARLLTMKGSAWFWPEGAMMFDRMYQSALGTYQVKADRQQTPTGFRTRAYS